MRYLVLLLTIFSFREVTAAETPCPKDARVHKEKDLKKLESAVQKAAKAGSNTALKRLIACDFLIARPESEIGYFRRGQNITSELSKILKGVNFWLREDYGSQVNLESGMPRKLELIFRKDDSTGWYWAGLGAGIDDDFNKFEKDSYNFPSEEDH